MSADRTANPGLAARAGRWSAQHRKKAIWGWLAFALIAFMVGGALGTETQTNAQSGVGESGRAARTVDNAFPKHQVEQVLVQSNSATASDPSFRAAVGDVQRRLSAVPYTKAFESPYKPGNAGQISANGHSALLRFEIAGDENQAADRVGATLKATAAAQAAHRRFHDRAGRRCEHQQAAERFDRQGFQPGVRDLAADHARDPVDRIRRSGRGQRSDSARVDGRPRDDRTGRRDQPLLARRQLDQRGDPVDRLGGRRRLLDVLSAPRARGARIGAQRTGGAGGCGGDLGAGGARLGPDGDGRHGRHVPRGRIDVHVIRDRDDHRGRGGCGGLADRPAGAARLAGRPGREGWRADHQEHAVERRRERHLGADPDSRATTPPRLGNSRDGPTDRAGDSRVQHSYRDPGHRLACRKT